MPGAVGGGFRYTGVYPSRGDFARYFVGEDGLEGGGDADAADVKD